MNILEENHERRIKENHFCEFMFAFPLHLMKREEQELEFLVSSEVSQCLSCHIKHVVS